MLLNLVTPCYGQDVALVSLEVRKIIIPSHKEYDPSTYLSLVDISVDSHKNATTIAIKMKVSKTDPHKVFLLILSQRYLLIRKCLQGRG